MAFTVTGTGSPMEGGREDGSVGALRVAAAAMAVTMVALQSIVEGKDGDSAWQRRWRREAALRRGGEGAVTAFAARRPWQRRRRRAREQAVWAWYSATHTQAALKTKSSKSRTKAKNVAEVHEVLYVPT